jgi:hypothetical protein
MESLVSEIPAGDGKIGNLFTVYKVQRHNMAGKTATNLFQLWFCRLNIKFIVLVKNFFISFSPNVCSFVQLIKRELLLKQTVTEQWYSNSIKLLINEQMLAQLVFLLVVLRNSIVIHLKETFPTNNESIIFHFSFIAKNEYFIVF